MTKQTKILIGVGALAIVVFFLLKSKKKSNDSNNSSDKTTIVEIAESNTPVSTDASGNPTVWQNPGFGL